MPYAEQVVGGEQLEVLAAAQIRVEARAFDEAGHAFERAGAVDQRVAAEELHGSLARPDQPEQHPQRRRLAGAVRAEEAVDVAGRDGEIDPGNGRDLPVPLDEAARFDRSGVRAQDVSARAAVSASDCVTEPATV